MFTGLIEEVGELAGTDSTERGARLCVTAPRISGEAPVGESIAVNGCCLTVVAHRGSQLVFDLLQETLDRTNLGRLRPGSLVNLERAMAANGTFGGHFVQGHIDCAVRIVAWEKVGHDYRLELELPSDFARYVAHKGSIAVNGISLTVAEISGPTFVVWIIPHTKEHTNLATARTGDWVNLEFDLIAKYVERLLNHSQAGS
jgi:riboflavin synthase